MKDKLRTCKTLERELANNKKILDAKKAGVDAARQQLVEMRQQKEQLEIMAADYEAQLKTLALEKTRSRIKLDDSRLAEIKASMDKLRERIETERKTAHAGRGVQQRQGRDRDEGRIEQERRGRGQGIPEPRRKRPTR